ncbi:MAG: hypothetical protein IJS60_02075 [Abditibacteriota bacterium]|nr:hypothetical protein [Abditibacteriota bacterium]
MKIKILGSGAAEGWPALFCACDACKKARELKGKNIRSRSSVLIDDLYMIDFGHDNFMHWAENDIDMTKIKDIFITHNHPDHFVYIELRMLSKWFSNRFREERVTLHGNYEVIMKALEKPLYEDNKLYLHQISPFDKVKLDDGHVFTAIKAEHRPGKDLDLNYIVEYGGKTFGYFLDTKTYTDNVTWDFLANYKFDALISECTFWQDEKSEHHQTFKGVLELKDRLKEIGAINEDTGFYLSHFSHNSVYLHDEMAEKAKPYGIEICYDGMEIEV